MLTDCSLNPSPERQLPIKHPYMLLHKIDIRDNVLFTVTLHDIEFVRHKSHPKIRQVKHAVLTHIYAQRETTGLLYNDI